MAIRSHGSDSDDGKPPAAPRMNHEHGGAEAINDPLLAWAVRTNFRYLGGQPCWVPLLIETAGETAAQVAAELPATLHNGEPLWQIPALFTSPPPPLDKMRHFVVLLNWKPSLRTRALDVPSLLKRKFRVRYEFGLPIGCPTQAPGDNPPPFTPFDISGPTTRSSIQSLAQAGVAIGIIDDGLAVAHERFREANGAETRIKSVWVQDLGSVGTEFFAADINAAVTACTHAGLVDEAEAYRTLGLEDFTHASHKVLSRRIAHGTHVMDVAAGYDPGTAPADRPIIGVQLPGRVVRDTSGASLTPFALWGMVYILARALTLGSNAGQVPVVINLSYGKFDEPHDGTSVFEQAVDEIVRLWNARWPQGRVCVVLPAGNNYLWRTHAHFSLAREATKRLEWRVVPDDRTPSIVEVWLPYESIGDPGIPSADATVTAPDGITSGVMQAGAPDFVEPPTASGLAPTWQVTYQTAAQTGSRPMLKVIVAPTAAYDPHNPAESVARSGIWHIELKNSGPCAQIDAWIRRSDTPLGWPILGRQSYFDDPAYVRFDGGGRYVESDTPSSYVRRLGTINGLATGASTVVVAGIRKSDLSMARYSAAGPIIGHPVAIPPSPRVGPDPDAAAVSDDSPARHGILGAGTRSNSVVAMGGTSVAAPQLTRWIADQAATQRPSCRYGVEDLANQEESTRPPPHPSAYRAGAGRIDDQEPPLPPPHQRR